MQQVIQLLSLEKLGLKQEQIGAKSASITYLSKCSTINSLNLFFSIFYTISKTFFLLFRYASGRFT